MTTSELASELSSNNQKAAAVARRLESSGFLRRVRKGVYAAVPLEADPHRFRPDPLLSARAILGPEYAFSHYSALTLLGLSHQEHQTVHVAKPGAKARRLRLGDRALHIHNVEPKNWEQATTQRKRGSQRLTVTTPERTLIDLLSLPPHRQDYEEIVHVFQDVLRRTNHTELTAKGKTWGTKAAQARLGHLILHHWEHSDEPPVDVKMSGFVTLKSPTYFGTKPKNPANRFDSKFNVVYPEGV